MIEIQTIEGGQKDVLHKENQPSKKRVDSKKDRKKDRKRQKKSNKIESETGKRK